VTHSGLILQELDADLTPDRFSDEWFSQPYAVLLESSLGGRWTIAAANPAQVLIADGSSNFLDRWQEAMKTQPVAQAPDLPFAGGWIGYLGYELYDEIVTKVEPRPVALVPKAVMAFYDQFYLFDHENKKAFFHGGRYPTAGPRRSTPTFGHLAASNSPRGLQGPPAGEFLRSVGQIKDLISAGDCYQVNLSQKFSVATHVPAPTLYRRLRDISPSPFAAYLNLSDAQILSSSPESFLEVDGRKVITRPIKGTRPRSSDPQEDARLKAELAVSTKDKAELLMITDLERNDLGRVCAPGSVRVRDLQTVESYPQVHHLVSTIEGELAPGRGLIDLLKATFPGGSITGAPKIRAMQIIRELEPHAREVYCGAIGFVSLNGKSQFNVAIRTMVVKNGEAHYWSGGGIVADSDPEQEYNETLVKARGMTEALS